MWHKKIVTLQHNSSFEIYKYNILIVGKWDGCENLWFKFPSTCHKSYKLILISNNIICHSDLVISSCKSFPKIRVFVSSDIFFNIFYEIWTMRSIITILTYKFWLVLHWNFNLKIFFVYLHIWACIVEKFFFACKYKWIKFGIFSFIKTWIE